MAGRKWLCHGRISAMTGLFAGMGKTRILLFSDAIATLVNVVLDAC